MPPSLVAPPSLPEQSVGDELLERSRREECADGLVDLAQDFPEETAAFIRTTLLVGLVSCLFPIICALYRTIYLPASDCCNRPLRSWMLIHCMITSVQVPLKAYFLRQLHLSEQRRLSTREFVRQLVCSVGWSANKVLSFASYGWLVLGLIWVVNAGRCELSRVCTFLVIVAALRTLLSWISFHYCFRSFSRQQQEIADVQMQHRGASLQLINSIPIMEYSPEVEADGGPETCCAVCLGDFSAAQALRRLPCGHKFHQVCIDKWLTRRKVCPLCLQDVEEITFCSGRKSHIEKKEA